MNSKKLFQIENISLADFRIKEIKLGEDYDQIDIISEGSYRISDSTFFKEIKIKNWEEFHVKKHVTQEGESFEIDWADDLETFEFIQELKIQKDGCLILNGFSEQSGAWLIYEFRNFDCNIMID